MKYFTACVVFALMALLAGCGGQGKHRIFGKLAYVTGTAQVFGTASGSWTPAQNGTSVCAGDTIRTSKEAEAVVTFGNSSIKLGENTCVTISDTVDSQNKRLIAVLNTGGEVLSDVKDIEQRGARYEVWTPTAVAHAEGTHFVVEFSPQPYVTHVRVLDGRVSVFNPFLPSAPPVLVSPGCYTTVAGNAAPVAVAPMNYGQFKKMQRLVGPRYYHDYEITFKISPDEMALDAPIVVVPIVPVPVFLPPGPPLPLGPHGRLMVSGPFLLPVPGMPLPHASHGGLIAPVPPLPPGPGMPLPRAPHGRMIAPVPPGPPIPSRSAKGRVVAPSPIGPIPVPRKGIVVRAGHAGGGNGKVNNHDEGDKGKHKGNKH